MISVTLNMQDHLCILDNLTLTVVLSYKSLATSFFALQYHYKRNVLAMLCEADLYHFSSDNN